MRKFGLIGYPLGHSFSRKYFSEKFEREGIADSVYQNFPIEDISMLPDLIKKEKDLLGLNVTIPYKTLVISYLDDVHPSAREIGSVNVIRIKRTNLKTLLSGYNSDVKGITDSIIPVMSSGIRNALILGSGGSSKAVRYSLEKLGLNVTIVSRESGKNKISYSELTPELMGSADLIVNTTPLGMFPGTESSPPLNYELLESRHILFDLVYNPEITAFLKKGQERGCRIITGLGMLYSQAERSWEIWNDPLL